MDFINGIKRWAGAITELGVVVIALGVVLQILFGDHSGAVPFLPVDVVGSILNLVHELGSEGLVGLVALGVIAWAFNRR